MPPAGHPGAGGLPRVSPRVLAGRLGPIAAITWAASPLLAVAQAVVAVVGGVTPASAAWLNRAVLNGLVPGAGRGRFAPPAAAAGGSVRRAAAPVLARHASTGHILALAAALGAVGLVSALIPYARRYCDQELKRRLGLVIQDRVFAAINSFPGLRRFETPRFVDQIRLAEQSSKTAPTQLVGAIFGSAQSLITVTGFLATLVVINPVLAVIVVATVVPSVAAELAMSRRRAGLQWRASPAVRRQIFYTRLLTDHTAVKEVRLFHLGDFLRRRMLREMHLIHSGERELDRHTIGVQGSLSLLTAVIAASGLVWTIGQAASGRLSIGDVTLFTMAVVGVQSGLSNLATKAADAYEALLVFGHYLDIVSAPPDLPLAPEPRRLPPLRTGIEVRDVWFRYDDRHPWALRGVSLFIPRGTSAALVGLNGAGKSTLVKLLCRMYDPDRGAILWDGTDIREFAPADLRARIGAVFQDYMSYELTAAENIGVGDLGSLDDREQIIRVARQAGIHDRLTGLPHGYDTMLSRIFFSNPDKDNPNPDAGVVLSGGQWQRLALARGLMRGDRDLLILDEPSSGLDAEAEHDIHQGLLAIRHGRTSLLISHRLGSVRDADMIFVLTGGRVAEQGSHDELMAAGGEYHRLFTLQASGYADGGLAVRPRQNPGNGAAGLMDAPGQAVVAATEHVPGAGQTARS